MNLTANFNALSMTSREIAELVGSRHDKVKQSIERLSIAKRGADQAPIDLPPMGEYLDSLGRPAAEYVFSGEKGKRDSIIVVAQICPEFTAALVDRWQELEAQIAQPVTLPSYAETLRLYADQIEETQRVTAERDNAIATKALIGSKREATAMATASAAAREARRLKEELGRGCLQATVTAVEVTAGRKLPKNAYVALRSWCKAHGVRPAIVPDSRFGKVKAWPAGAWLDVYQIDLTVLFGADGEQA